MLPKIIDTHIHVWDFTKARYSWLDGDTSILNKTYSIQELEGERGRAGITEGILVQAANNFEDTDWMLKVADRTEWISGVVGWLPLTEPEQAAEALAAYQSNPYFKGVRHLIHNEADPAWLLQDTVIESLKHLAGAGLPYDVVGVTVEHLEAAIIVANKVPHLKLVFDHLNQPPIAKEEKFGRWGALLQEAAALPNCYAKISGLGLTAAKGLAWAAADLQPYIEFALEQFGEDRCCCGGDWPVALLAGSYTDTWQAYKEILDKRLDKEAKHKVLYSNAKKIYGLN
jgi:L-fuconolactonase